ncbi:MAG TPA: hypothetical protein VG101_04360 [Puia sp.]|jgi:hypothetical protein|nr:hypothetical protein [Puia sp.]
MKFSCNRAFALSLISSAFLVAFASCSKSNNNNSGSGFSATVSGTAWASNYPTGGTFTSSNGEFTVAGLQIKGGDSTAFGLFFFSPVTLNQAINSSTSSVDIQYADAKTGVLYDGASVGHSIVTVTSYDSTGHKVGGTFSGVLYDTSGDSLVIVNGKFNTAFTAQ